LVDEVLAVGDLAFQQKCLGKMDEVSRHGRTVLFVSHQMNQMRRLCARCIWLDGGRVVEAGPTADVIGRYEAALMAPAASDSRRAGNARAKFGSWRIAGQEGAEHVLMTTGRVVVRFDLDLSVPVRNGHHGIGLHDPDGELVWGAGTDNLRLDPGRHVVEYVFETLPVRPGPYRWHVTLFEDQTLLDDAWTVPELSVATVPTGHRRDECAGVLNVPFSIDVAAAERTQVEAALVR
jgi:lipopolysaccharide transport system ATP-binding protein